MKLKLFFFFSALLLTDAAMAGHETGNGGGGIVCESSNEVLFLDLWEAASLRSMNLVSGDTSVNENLKRAFTRIEEYDYPDSKEVIDFATRIFQQLQSQGGSIPIETELQPPADALTQFVKRGCKLHGIALYFDTYDSLLVDYELYDKLSSLDKAALIIHEAIYYYLRKNFGVSNSIAARGITACMFSEQRCEQFDLSQGQPEKYYKCSDQFDPASTESLSFYAYQVNQTWKFQFEKINGLRPPTLSYIEIPSERLSIARNNHLSEKFHFTYFRKKIDPYFTRTSDNMWKDIGIKLDIPVGQVKFNEDHSYFELNGRSLIECVLK